MTEKLLSWNPMVARMPDNHGSTPLHFAASFGNDKIARILLKRDYSLAYLHDSCGSFPVHVAAKMGHCRVIIEILNHCPDSDELLDNKGRNFLHVAAQEGKFYVVKLVCRTTSKYKSMKNARDTDGNTPLHLAMDSDHEMIVKVLMQDKEVFINISNKRGLTPRDQSAIANFNDNTITPIFQKVNFWREKSMEFVGAYYGSRRWDQLVEDHTTMKDDVLENKKLTDAIQTIGLGSVLIATATFAAAFALPGGYRADDDPKAGSPTLADRYAFKAFLFSDTLAFIFSFQSTMILLFGGVTSSKPHLKKKFVSTALWCIIFAARCTVISFGIAIFVVLSPVNKVLGILAILLSIYCQFDGMGRDYRFTDGVISARRGKRLWQNKLPEATLRWSLPASLRYNGSMLWHFVECLFPLALATVGPLIIDLVLVSLQATLRHRYSKLWYFGEFCRTFPVAIAAVGFLIIKLVRVICNSIITLFVPSL